MNELNYLSVEKSFEVKDFKKNNNIKNCCIVIIELTEETDTYIIGARKAAIVLNDYFLVIDFNYAIGFNKAKIVHIINESDLTN